MERSSHREFFRRIILVLAVLGYFTLVFAKDDKQKDSSDVKFTARTELVLVPTLVTDKSGVHIRGLKKEDFTIRENGVEQKVATFEEIASDAHRLSRPRDPQEFSNSLVDGGSRRRITLIVLDFVNTSFGDQAYARKNLLEYLTESVDKREPTALYTLTRGGIHVVHDFTADPRVLVAALHKVKGDPVQMVDSPEDVETVTGTASPDGSAGIDPAAVLSEANKIQSMMEDAELNFQSFEQRVAIMDTLQAMQQVAQTLAGFPGRKSLIWASGGFPFSVSDETMQLAPAGRDTLSDVFPFYERTWQLLNDAQIALYPVDVKGLQTNVASASIGRPGTNYLRNTNWRQLDTRATFQTFAAMTGGRAYYNSNDLQRGFREAVSDSAQYYMLGYYLDRTNTKPGWRKLAVKVNRDHVEVRGRSGFFVTHATTNPESSRHSDIIAALQSPLDYTALALAVRWDPIEAGREPGKKRAIYHLTVAVDPALIDPTDHNHVSLDFVTLAKTNVGKAIDQPIVKTIEAHLKDEIMAETREKGIFYRGALDLPPGEYTVRFVVRDDLNGRVGSVATPLRVD
jgi:VWFA-related protein